MACRNHVGWSSSTRVENGLIPCPTKLKKWSMEQTKVKKWIQEPAEPC